MPCAHIHSSRCVWEVDRRLTDVKSTLALLLLARDRNQPACTHSQGKRQTAKEDSDIRVRVLVFDVLEDSVPMRSAIVCW